MKHVLPAALLTLVLAAACGSSDSPTVVADQPTTAPTPTAAATTAAPAPTSTLPAGVDASFAFTVAGDTVTPSPGRTKVAKGSTVQLVVTSDVADEVHLHGYDKMVDVAEGGTVTLTFKATIPGVFEVELEDSKTLITRVQVS